MPKSYLSTNASPCVDDEIIINVSTPLTKCCVVALLFDVKRLIYCANTKATLSLCIAELTPEYSVAAMSLNTAYMITKEPFNVPLAMKVKIIVIGERIVQHYIIRSLNFTSQILRYIMHVISPLGVYNLGLYCLYYGKKSFRKFFS